MQAERLVERLTATIVDTIRSEGLGPGEALPAARGFAEQLGVTVPTLREALRRLEAVGVVELRHGSGTYVGPSFQRRILDNPYYSPIGMTDAVELLDARIAIEPGIASLAAVNCDELSLRDLSDAANAALSITPAARPGLFHSALAASTGNRALREALDSLLIINARAQQTARVTYDRVLDHKEHLSIVDAIERGDSVEAAHRTESHLRNIKRTVVAAGDGA
ncbi:MAG: FadR family transcriptional regulator [Actinomycetales bacterium]|nr:FadR family transcriptional regulator [Actinomycetales bacterium]